MSDAVPAVEKDITKKKKKSKSTTLKYGSYLHKIFKGRKPELSIGKEVMELTHGLILHLEEKLTDKAFELGKVDKKMTLSERHVHGAARIALPMALSERACKEGHLALVRFRAAESAPTAA